MGCDIHLFFEEKDKDENWHAMEIPPYLVPDDRNYLLFEYVAGVRGCGELDPVFPLRGIPKDSPHRYLLGHDSFHSCTYFTWKEMSLVTWPEGLDRCYFRMFFDYVLPRFTINIDSIRVIVCFDN